MDNTIPSWAPGLRISSTGTPGFVSEYHATVYVPDSDRTNTCNVTVNLTFTWTRFGILVRGSTFETPWGTCASISATFPDFGEGQESIERRMESVQVIVNRILYACGCERAEA